MRSPARLEWEKAKRLMAEVRMQDPDATPLSVVSAAYYAMFHAALASNLIDTVSPPKKHSSVKRQFGHLVKDCGDAVRKAGHDLTVMLDLRIKAGYEAAASVTAVQARAAVLTASSFLDLCTQEFGFEPGGSMPDG